MKTSSRFRLLSDFESATKITMKEVCSVLVLNRFLRDQLTASIRITIRMIIILPLFLILGKATAGTITGTVRAQGKAGANADAQCGKYDSRQFKFLERVNYEEMHDFVVYVEGPIASSIKPPEKPQQV